MADLRKCEPSNRVWPGQKCDRCQRQNLDCSEPISLLGHSAPSQHIPPQGDSDTRLPASVSSGTPLPGSTKYLASQKAREALKEANDPNNEVTTLLDFLGLVKNNYLPPEIYAEHEGIIVKIWQEKAASPVGEDLPGTESRELQADGSKSSASLGVPHRSVSILAGQNNGAPVQNQTATANDQRYPQAESGDDPNDGNNDCEDDDHDDNENQDLSPPVDVQTRLASRYNSDSMKGAEAGSHNTLGQHLSRSVEDDGLEDIGPPKKKARSLETTSKRTFACPYWKKDPMKHRDCLRAKLLSASRVKQHLHRNHTPRFFCQRCFTTFLDDDEQDQHITQSNCIKPTDFVPDFIRPNQQLQLSRKPKLRLTEEEKWYRTWDIVFPSTPRPDSPYLGELESDALESFRAFFQQYGPELMEREIAQSSLSTTEMPPDHMRNILSKVLSRSLDVIWESRLSNTGSSEHSLIAERAGRAMGSHSSITEPSESSVKTGLSSTDTIAVEPGGLMDGLRDGVDTEALFQGAMANCESSGCTDGLITGTAVDSGPVHSPTDQLPNS